MVERLVQTRAPRSIDPASRIEQVRIIGFHSHLLGDCRR